GVVGVARNDGNSGLYDVVITDWNGNMTRDVTQKISGGTLAAYVELRDKDLPSLIAKNNEMAFGFANAFNEVHRQGFGLKDYAEVQGRNFFRVPADVANAAQDLDLDDAITTSNDAIAAASSPMAPGDNV